MWQLALFFGCRLPCTPLLCNCRDDPIALECPVPKSPQLPTRADKRDGVSADWVIRSSWASRPFLARNCVSQNAFPADANIDVSVLPTRTHASNADADSRHTALYAVQAALSLPPSGACNSRRPAYLCSPQDDGPGLPNPLLPLDRLFVLFGRSGLATTPERRRRRRIGGFLFVRVRPEASYCGSRPLGTDLSLAHRRITEGFTRQSTSCK